MPTYDYTCDACGHRFERFQSFHEPPVAACPACAGAVRRVFTPAPIIFKGSGWYVTDSKRATATATDMKPGANGAEAAGTAGQANGAEMSTNGEAQVASSPTAGIAADV